MSDFRQPPLDYMAEHLREKQLAEEQQFYAGYRRPLNGPMMPGVEEEGSWLASRHNPKNAGK